MVYKWFLLGAVTALALQWTLKEVQADSQLSEDELALLREVKELASAKRANLEARDISCNDDDIDCICRYYGDLCFDCSAGCGDADECMTECLQESLENRMLETALQQQRNLDNSLNDENAAKKRTIILRRRVRFRRFKDWGHTIGK